MDRHIIDLLNNRAERYNHPDFIESDPILIPHGFNDPEDIAIAGFLTALIAWGQRPVILRNARFLMELMDNSPAHFIRHSTHDELKPLRKFVHRTFSGRDCLWYVNRLAQIYGEGKTLEELFRVRHGETDMGPAISRARETFLDTPGSSAHSRHFANPSAGSAAKRINMFLRWMIRKDNTGVDFGIWKEHDPSLLVCPLDVHSGNTARHLGLLSRRASDWRSAMELTENLRLLDPADPARYDFALFGLGIFEGYAEQ